MKYIISEKPPLVHYGVKGMRWGQRKGPGSASAQRKAHVTEVKALKKAARTKRRDRWRKDTDEMQKKEDVAYEKLRKVFNKDMADIDASEMTRGKKFLARGKRGTKFERDTMNVVGKIEGDYVRKERIRKKTTKKAKQAAEFKLDTEMADLFQKMYNSQVKGKPPLQGIKAFSKMNKEHDRIAEIAWKKLDLKYA